MSHRWLAVSLTCILVLTARAQSQQSASDESALRQVVRNYRNARNTEDAGATRALFTSDADQLVSSGEWRKGLDALVRGAMASSQKEAAKSSITVKSIRFVTSDVAIVDGRYETYSSGSAVPRKMWTTLIVKRTDDGWKIAAIRNMLPAPANPR